MTAAMVERLLERHGQTLYLIRRETSQSISGDTGAPERTPTDSAPWSGTGVLQANIGRDREDLRATAGGVDRVQVAYQAYLPWDAHPRPGWILRDELGQEFEMVTEPLLPGGARSYWLLNLGPPTRALDSAYISAGFWVEV